MAAKNKQNLSKFVGFTYFRNARSQWAWHELASARATVATLDTTAQSVDVVCDTRWSVFKWVIPEAMVSLTFLENADTWILSKLFGISETAQAAGSKTITSESFTFGPDDKIVLPYYSNDWSWVTVSSIVWYTLTDDYLVTVSDNETTITRVPAWDISEGATVQITWSVTVNASQSTEIVSQFMVKPEFEVMIVAKVTRDGKDYRRIVSLNPATLESTYNLDFLDAVKAGDINGTTAEFKLSEGGKFKMYDEIITEEISG